MANKALDFIREICKRYIYIQLVSVCVYYLFIYRQNKIDIAERLFI